MASLRRDTPAGRAALARRRQRAAAVVEHQSRFVNDGEEDDDEGENPNASPSPAGHYTNVNAEANARQPAGAKPAPKPSQQHQQQSVEFQSPDKLLERSARVAQTAATVLASVRKSRPPHQHQHQQTSSYVTTEEPERSIEGVSSSRPPTDEQSFYQMPTVSSFQKSSDQEQSGNDTTTSNASNRRQIEHARRLRENRLEVTPKPKSNNDDITFISRDSERMDHMDHEDQFSTEEFDGGQQERLQQQLVRQEEEFTTAEGIEPTMPKQEDGDEDRHPASLATGSVVVLRSVETSATVTIHGESMAMVGGAGISATDEVFEILKFTPQGNGLSIDQAALRWGDTIAIVSPDLVDPSNEKPKALGIRRLARRPSRVPHGAPVQHQIGCFRSVRGPSEMWTVLRGPDRSSDPLLVGMASLENSKRMAQERAARGEVTMQVQSGDPILLRNMDNGGLLTVNPTNGMLELLMDAYDSRQTGSTNMDSLEQLQRNCLYVPTDRETFVLLESSVPPCPRWILGGGTSTSCNSFFNPLGHRMYLHQTYTAEPGRDNMSRSLQAVLFGHQGPSKTGLEVSADSVKRMKLADQESLLLDEVIGACLGLEGNFIRTSMMREEEMPQVDGSGIERPQHLEFNFTGETDLLFDSGLRNLARGLMPLATSYMHVSEFVASHLPGYEFGSVMQALCEALEAILKEYTDFVGKMEQQFRFPQPGEGNLTLQRLYVHLMPSLDSLALLKRVIMAIRGKSGGALVNCLAILQSESCEGDLVANKVLSFLLDRSSIPYMAMLTTWLQYGLLKDPYNEFMIEVRPGKHSSTLKHAGESDVSDESYILKEEHVLTELMASDVLLQKVAATGKYRRAARLCQNLLRKAVVRTEEENDLGTSPKLLLRYSMDFNSLSSFIQSMYEGASGTLVSLLLKDFNLLDALRSMKQYFLLDHGDFLENFLNSAEDELVKDLGDISSGRIQHWLRTAVQLGEADQPTSSAHPSTNVPRLSPLALRCRFVPISLIQHVDSFHSSGEGDTAKSIKDITRDDSILGTPLRDAYGISNKGLTGVETFMLEYPSVPFPISLVLRDSALDSYQLLFRLLFFAKYSERRLLSIWQDHQAMKELSSVRGLFGPTFLLRQRMLHFAQNLIYYFVAEVIEPNWVEMEEAIGNPSTAYRRTVDDLVDVHSAFLQRTIEACLLTNKELVRTLTKLMTTCLMFADQMKLFTEATRIYDESSHIANERREAIQRSLNDRVSGGQKVADKKALREAIHSFKHDRQVRLKKQKRRVGRELASESYRRMVGRFEEVFSAYLSEFMTQLKGDVGTSHYTHRTNLCSRLDYNGFMFSSLQRAEN